MSSTLWYHSVQAPGAVQSAQLVRAPGAAGQDKVLVVQDTNICSCKVTPDGLEQGTTWRTPASILQTVYLPSHHVLLLYEGGQCCLLSLPADDAAMPKAVAHTALQAVADAPSLRQPFGCTVSNVLSAQTAEGTASMVAVSYQQGMLHLVRAIPMAHQNISLQSRGMPYKQALLGCSVPDVSSSPLMSLRVHSRILALAWLTDQEQKLDVQGSSMLAVLHEFSPSSQPPVLHVDCLAVDWVDGSVSPGPWSIRNVHPTTRLLHSFTGSNALPAGMLVVSSRSVLLCTCQGQKPEAVHDAHCNSTGTAAHTLGQLSASKMQLLQWCLDGLPVSIVPVSDNSYLVGDDRAGLYLLHLLSKAAPASCQRIVTTSPTAVPDVLVYAPLPSTNLPAATDSMEVDQQDAEAQQQGSSSAGLLFVGSRSSSSQVVGIPQSCLSSSNVPQQGQQVRRQQHTQKQQLQQQCVCPVLQSAFLPSLAGAQAVMALQDSTGNLPEQQLLIACGASCRGKLALVRSGCGLSPFKLDGPLLPGDAVLFPMAEHPTCPPGCRQQQQQQQPPLQQQQHSLLGFSFPSAGATEVLSLQGPTFKQLQLKGLQHGSESLLLAGVPGGWLLQVTAAGVYVLHREPTRQLLHQWNPQGASISLAAASGCLLVVACGNQLTALRISCCDGLLHQLGSGVLQQQASAVALLQLSGGQVLIAAGLWVDNSLLLLPWPSSNIQQQQQLEVGCLVQLTHEQPRSVAALPVGDCDVLLVGLNSGRVLMWELSTASQQERQQQSDAANAAVGAVHATNQWVLQHPRVVQISSTAVRLQQIWLPAQPGGCCVTTSSSLKDSTSPEAPGQSSAGATVSSSYTACIYAHSGAGAVIRTMPGLLSSQKEQQQQQRQQQGHNAGKTTATNAGGSLTAPMLAATDCLLISRLCGSDACLSTAAIHTSDMPHSLAWVSAGSRLCFGGIDAAHKLRWRSMGLPGTPLAVSLHKATNVLVLLVQVDSASVPAKSDEATGRQQGQLRGSQQPQQRQQLVLLNVTTWRVLMVVTLTDGHLYTTLAVLDLPCTSQQQQQPHLLVQQQVVQQQQTSMPAEAAAAANQGVAASPSGCRPFIVLGSVVNLDLSNLSTAAKGSGGSQPAAGTLPAAHQQQQQQHQGQRRLPQDVEILQEADGGLQQQVAEPPDSWSRDKVAAAASAALGTSQVAVLSVFDLRTSRPVVTTVRQQQLPQHDEVCNSADLRFDLILQGMVPLSCTPASLCTVVPELLTQQQQQQQQGLGKGHKAAAKTRKQDEASTAEGGPANATPNWPPLLVVGNEGGVSVFSVVVDDAGVAGERQLQEQLAQAAEVDMDIDPTTATAGEAALASSSSQQAPSTPQQQPLSRVSVVELSTCKGLLGTVVRAVSSSGSSIIATESLGSVTIFQALATPGGRVHVLPVGADHSGLMAMDVISAATAAPTAAAAASAAAVDQPCTSGAGDRPSSDIRAEESSPTHQALLVAMHPVGLILLQRDLAAEQEHQQAAREAAIRAWEAGVGWQQQQLQTREAGHGARQLLQQQQQLLAAAMQPWLGAGEVAPWVAAGVQQPIGRGLGGVAGDVVGHNVLATTAAAAADGVGGNAAESLGVGLLNLGASEAPQLLPSAACAPAPGTTLMCAARLGLHSRPAIWFEARESSDANSMAAGSGENSSSTSSTTSSSSTSGTAATSAFSQPVWCFSASGAVSMVQLLQPVQASVLRQLQSSAEKTYPSQQRLKLELVLQLQPGVSNKQLLLRPLKKLCQSAKFSNYQRSVARALASDVPDEEDLPYNCLDGDWLTAADRAATAGSRGSTSGADSQEQLGWLLHRMMLRDSM